MPTLYLGEYVAHFEHAGYGPPLLLLPGALGTGSSDFAPQIEFFRQHYEVVAPDPRGYGGSRPPERDFPLSFYTRDAADALALMDALGHKTFAVLGWSDGANSATVLAIEHPDRVSRLVVWGGNPTITADDLHFFQSIRSLATWSPRTLSPMHAIYGDTLAPLWERYIAGLEALYAAGGELYRTRLSGVRCPTLILHGDLDAHVPLLHPQTLHQGIPGAELIRFPEGKHNIHLRYAGEFNRIVAAFLAGGPTSPVDGLQAASSPAETSR